MADVLVGLVFFLGPRARLLVMEVNATVSVIAPKVLGCKNGMRRRNVS